ncbi:hypothetical protein SDC9_126187 [bioreactor metagenome]|uniref:Uncharacterized protein n=1 Tax=bioreactor metagenome TaxID=1076179 RepID=A0A645CQK1_9ZZZZ
MLELAAPRNPVAGRYFDFGVNHLLCLRDERAEVAAPHVGGDDDAALAILAIDHVRAGGYGNLGHLSQRNKRLRIVDSRLRIGNMSQSHCSVAVTFALRQRHGQMLQGLNVRA